jgi:hypothetical protein
MDEVCQGVGGRFYSKMLSGDLSGRIFCRLMTQGFSGGCRITLGWIASPRQGERQGYPLPN